MKTAFFLLFSLSVLGEDPIMPAAQDRERIGRLIAEGWRGRDWASDYRQMGAAVFRRQDAETGRIFLERADEWRGIARRKWLQAIDETIRVYRLRPELSQTLVAFGEGAGLELKWAPRLEEKASGSFRNIRGNEVRVPSDSKMLGIAWPDGTVIVVPRAFQSSDVLAAVLFHEKIHFEDLADPAFESLLDREIRAYLLTINFYDRLGLSGPSRQVSAERLIKHFAEKLRLLGLRGDPQALVAWQRFDWRVRPWAQQRLIPRPHDFLPPRETLEPPSAPPSLASPFQLESAEEPTIGAPSVARAGWSSARAVSRGSAVRTAESRRIAALPRAPASPPEWRFVKAALALACENPSALARESRGPPPSLDFDALERSRRRDGLWAPSPCEKSLWDSLVRWRRYDGAELAAEARRIAGRSSSSGDPLEAFRRAREGVPGARRTGRGGRSGGATGSREAIEASPSATREKGEEFKRDGWKD